MPSTKVYRCSTLVVLVAIPGFMILTPFVLALYVTVSNAITDPHIRSVTPPYAYIVLTAIVAFFSLSLIQALSTQVYIDDSGLRYKSLFRRRTLMFSLVDTIKIGWYFTPGTGRRHLLAVFYDTGGRNLAQLRAPQPLSQNSVIDIVRTAEQRNKRITVTDTTGLLRTLDTSKQTLG